MENDPRRSSQSPRSLGIDNPSAGSFCDRIGLIADAQFRKERRQVAPKLRRGKPKTLAELSNRFSLRDQLKDLALARCDLQ
jgi:hypothetical protein